MLKLVRLHRDRVLSPHRRSLCLEHKKNPFDVRDDSSFGAEIDDIGLEDCHILISIWPV